MVVKVKMTPAHPGGFLKRSVLPDDLTVQDAADRLGVGRPALSRLLNEHADLSPEMAYRVEMVFGFKTETLLRMQANYAAAAVRKRAAEIKIPRKRENAREQATA